MTSTASKKCKATNRRGEPCGAYAMEGSDYCYWHDPALAEERRKARAKGGHARHGRKIGSTGGADPVEIETAADVLPVLSEEINELRKLERSVKRARAIGYLCGQVVRAFEVSELQTRVEALEAVLGGRER